MKYRSYSVLIGKQGNGFAFTSDQAPALQVKFSIEKTALSTPNKATFSLYNLAPSTSQKVAMGDQIVFTAGHDGNNSLLFSGQITQIADKWENSDTILELEAGDGDFDYYNAIVLATVAAGQDQNSAVAAALASFKQVTAGPVNVAKTSQRLRGKVLAGPTRDVLTAVAKDLNSHWSIQDGKLVVCGVDKALPTSQIPLVSASTGMEGFPTVTEKGVTVTVRLLPSLVIGGLFRLETSRPIVTIAKGQTRQDPNGTYKVTKITHSGDYRGDGVNSWSSAVECVRFSA